MNCWRVVFLAVAGWVAISPRVFAESIEKIGEIEVDWIASVVRHRGAAKLTSADGSSFKPVEGRIWKDALTTALPKELTGFLQARLGPYKLPETPAMKKLVAATSSVSTTYFSDDGMEIQFETQLPKLLFGATGNRSKAAAESESEDRQAVVLTVKGRVTPTLTAEVRGSQGETLVGAQDLVTGMAHSSRGFWVSSRTKLEDKLGGKVVRLAAETAGPGVFKLAEPLPDGLSTQTLQELAQAGRFVIALP